MKAPKPKRDGARRGVRNGPAQLCRSAITWRKLRGLVTAVTLLACLPSALAQGPESNEYQLKLAFLYNFAQFVDWPADSFHDPAAPLAICVAGDNPFQGEIGEGLRGRTVKGHPLEVRKLGAGEDLRACQMVFVRAGEKRLIPSILASARGSNTLTVGEADGFARHGGIINITRNENRLRFEVNLSAAGRTHLKISSKLLALATIVAD